MARKKKIPTQPVIPQVGQPQSGQPSSAQGQVQSGQPSQSQPLATQTPPTVENVYLQTLLDTIDLFKFAF